MDFDEALCQISTECHRFDTFQRIFQGLYSMLVFGYDR